MVIRLCPSAFDRGWPVARSKDRHLRGRQAAVMPSCTQTKRRIGVDEQLS